MKSKFQFTRVFDILAYQQSRYPQKRAVNIFSQDKWQATSISQFIEVVDVVSCWLISQGFKKGDMLAIMPELGNLDWLIIDFASQQLGIIVVPIHASSSADELNLILSETNPVMLIVASADLFERTSVAIVNKETPLLCLEPTAKKSFHTAYNHTPNTEEKDILMKFKEEVKPDDILTIMYTSGTSGEPKGTILTHNNMVSNILFTLAAFPLQASKRVMSYLPFSHILERSAGYAYLACGASIYFVRSKDSFLVDFQSAKPYFSTSVPKVLERMYDYLQEQTLAQNWIKRTITNWSLKTAQAYNRDDKKRILLSFKLLFARLFVLNRWRNQLGGKLECMVVGAASLQPEIARMFSAAKIRIREGYGMTEASPLISLNRFSPGLNRFGTVGIPIPALDLQIAEKDEDGVGEIQIKGPNVTQGYFKRPELNKSAFTEDGWFKTGDIGRFVDGRFLQITDRKKDIFKTSAGKYIAPQPLENSLKSSRFILQCLVIGFSRPSVSALIVPNFVLLEEWCQLEGIHWTAPEYMVHNIKVREKFEKEVAFVNKELPNYKQIKDFILLAEEWTEENKLLTTTQKPIRKSLLELNEKALNKLYS